MAREKRTISPNVPLMTTTLWDYPSQNYPGSQQGDTRYVGATPSYVIWNLLQRYTEPNWLVVDPMCGSGTTLDVARDLNRKSLGYDIEPNRKDIFRADARKLPLESGKADFVFVDPPYSDHVKYSGKPDCIGELDARRGKEYYRAMEKVIGEIDRVLRPDRYMALYVSDSAKKGKPLEPIGFKLFEMLCARFTPVDVVAVVRHNRTLMRQRFHDASVEGHFYLRGFNYLFIMAKERGKKTRASAGATPKPSTKKTTSKRRDPDARGPAKRKAGSQKTTSRKTSTAGSKSSAGSRGPARKKTSSRGGGRKRD
jgi:SAM-dependent methyltransferase